MSSHRTGSSSKLTKMPFAAAINAVNVLCTAPVAAANTVVMASMWLEVNGHAGFCCKLKKQETQLMARPTCQEIGKHFKIFLCDLLPNSPEGIRFVLEVGKRGAHHTRICSRHVHSNRSSQRTLCISEVRTGTNSLIRRAGHQLC